VRPSLLVMRGVYRITARQPHNFYIHQPMQSKDQVIASLCKKNEALQSSLDEAIETIQALREPSVDSYDEL